MTTPPQIPEPPPIESYPHRFRVYYLSEPAEQRFLQLVLQVLGFSPELQSGPMGQSGLKHSAHLVGLQRDTKHAVICQSGFQRAFAGRRPPTNADAYSWFQREEPLPDREDRIRRELLFAAYDLKAKFEAEGWTCDILYFLNATSPEEGGIELDAFAPGPTYPAGRPAPVLYSKSGSTAPILRIPLAELRRNAISTGACFLELSDIRPEELGAITESKLDEAEAATLQLLRRLRIPEYFRPPVDELLLGMLAKFPQGLSEQQLAVAPGISAALQHPPSEPRHIALVDYRDPLAVVQALQREKHLRVKGSLAFTTDSGAQVAYEFEKSAEESWVQKVVRLLSLAKVFLGGK